MYESEDERASRERQEDFEEREHERVLAKKRHQEHMEKLDKIIALLCDMDVYDNG